MKTIKILTFAASLFAMHLFAMQMLASQNPAISTVYSDSEIVKMMEQFRSAKSQDVIPPIELQQKFRADFPNARDVEWETANEIFEVEFEIRFRDFKAFYDKNGNLLMVVEEIRSSELPAVVKNAAEAKYPKFRFDDIYKVRRGTETFYKVEMEKSKTEVKLLISSSGVILN